VNDQQKWDVCIECVRREAEAEESTIPVPQRFIATRLADNIYFRARGESWHNTWAIVFEEQLPTELCPNCPYRLEMMVLCDE
jgi:hypothetical protein